MQRVSLEEVVARSELFEKTDRKVSLIAMYLYDDTELKEYIKKNEDDKLVVALAYLDNYEEALESVEDVRRSLLIALIDRKITKYFSNFDGLVKKLEKDKYFLIMQPEFTGSSERTEIPHSGGSQDRKYRKRDGDHFKYRCRSECFHLYSEL